MTLVLDTGEYCVRDRAEVVRTAIAETMVPVEIAWPNAVAQVAASGVISDLGELTLCSIRSTATVVERTPALARDDLEPSIFFGLQLTGSSLVIQGGREAVVRPGSLVVYDSTAPYTLVDGNGVAQEFFRIPHSALALSHNAIRSVCATPLSHGHPITALTVDYLTRLAACPELLLAPNADIVGHPSIELIRAVITTHLDAAREPMQATLPVRILEYARAHLGDPGLTAERIAAEHYISVRYLYKMLAHHDISLATWIRTHRLEECRKELSHSGAQIAAVARRWGFSDMSAFSRAFRAEYGVSPRDWRDGRL